MALRGAAAALPASRAMAPGGFGLPTKEMARNTLPSSDPSKMMLESRPPPCSPSAISFIWCCIGSDASAGTVKFSSGLVEMLPCPSARAPSRFSLMRHVLPLLTVDEFLHLVAEFERARAFVGGGHRVDQRHLALIGTVLRGHAEVDGVALAARSIDLEGQPPGGGLQGGALIRPQQREIVDRAVRRHRGGIGCRGSQQAGREEAEKSFSTLKLLGGGGPMRLRTA